MVKAFVKIREAESALGVSGDQSRRSCPRRTFPRSAPRPAGQPDGVPARARHCTARSASTGANPRHPRTP